MSESLLISFEEAGRLLGGLHPNTLRQRKAGTEKPYSRYRLRAANNAA
ncbi:MAG TPA: hypothetical protein VEW46_14070 [Pyrinomonadaceae bacterium]|nr:hypothetical protein [Pyrinomonadaceae bacterium]